MRRRQRGVLLENIGVIQIRNVRRFLLVIMLDVEGILSMTKTMANRMTELKKTVTAMVAALVMIMAIVEMEEENETLD